MPDLSPLAWFFIVFGIVLVGGFLFILNEMRTAPLVYFEGDE